MSATLMWSTQIASKFFLLSTDLTAGTVWEGASSNKTPSVGCNNFPSFPFCDASGLKQTDCSKSEKTQKQSAEF